MSSPFLGGEGPLLTIVILDRRTPCVCLESFCSRGRRNWRRLHHNIGMAWIAVALSLEFGMPGLAHGVYGRKKYITMQDTTLQHK